MTDKSSSLPCAGGVPRGCVGVAHHGPEVVHPLRDGVQLAVGPPKVQPHPHPHPIPEHHPAVVDMPYRRRKRQELLRPGRAEKLIPSAHTHTYSYIHTPRRAKRKRVHTVHSTGTQDGRDLYIYSNSRINFKLKKRERS